MMTNNLLTQMRNAPDDPAAMLLPSATRALTIVSIELTSRCSEHSLLGAQLARSSLRTLALDSAFPLEPSDEICHSGHHCIRVCHLEQLAKKPQLRLALRSRARRVHRRRRTLARTRLLREIKRHSELREERGLGRG